jgi:hypothetical protein
MFAAVQKLRFIKLLDCVAVPINIKHSDVGGCSDMERVVRDFVRTKCMVVNLMHGQLLLSMKIASECITEMVCIPAMIPMLLCWCCARVGDNPAGASVDCRPRKYSICMILVILSPKVLKNNCVRKLSSLIIYPRSKFYLTRSTRC